MVIGISGALHGIDGGVSLRGRRIEHANAHGRILDAR